jgi:F-type H+-transporting ATPase subunit b
VLINWFTVFAQMLNFLILVALLRWFLYKPILKVMHKRQALIEERWQEAERLKSEAEQTLATYQQQQQELQQQQATWLAEAHLAADQERQRLLVQLRQEIADRRTAWQADLRQEQDSFLRSLRQQVIHQISAIARQALRNLANADLEGQMIRVFCDRLHHLEPPQRQAIAQALSQTRQPIPIRSSFEMPADLRQTVIDELHSQFSIVHPIEFVTASNLLCGIEIKLVGQEIVWSLDTYLQTLEQRLSATLAQEGASHHELHISTGAGCLF